MNTWILAHSTDLVQYAYISEIMNGRFYLNITSCYGNKNGLYETLAKAKAAYTKDYARAETRAKWILQKNKLI